MENRFHLFENITLPSLACQTDQDFKVFVATSPNMPEPFHKRLAQACAAVPQIEIFQSTQHHISDAIREHVSPYISSINEKSFHFRMDDDDALASDMIKTMRYDSTRQSAGTLMSYPKGFFAAPTKDGVFFSQKFEPYIAIGYGTIARKAIFRSPYDGRHAKEYQLRSSFVNPNPFAYLHVGHMTADTAIVRKKKIEQAKQFDTASSTENGKTNNRLKFDSSFHCFDYSQIENVLSSLPFPDAKTLNVMPHRFNPEENG